MNGLLPAILPPRDLTELIRTHYDRSYADASAHFSSDLYEWALESWEEDVLERHGIRSGRILVLGAGVGRESLAIAGRGLRVVGLDINLEALKTGGRAAEQSGRDAVFVQGDFLSLPICAGEFRYILLSGIMYSAIPGRRERQGWLRSLRRYLEQDGLVVLNFMIERWALTRSRRLLAVLNRCISSVPGANRSYQAGDTCAQSHFLHAFQNEAEIRDELVEAGVVIQELSWLRGYAVVSLPATD